MDLDFGFTDLLNVSVQGGQTYGNAESPNDLLLNECDFVLNNQFYEPVDSAQVN